VPRVDHELDTQNFERFGEDMNMNSPGENWGSMSEHRPDAAAAVLA
jgi:hypothetical protein